MNTIEYWNNKWKITKTYHEETRKELFAELQQYLRNKILDIGCGDGMLGQPQGSRYHGVDFSKEAIKIATNNCPHGTFYAEDISKKWSFESKTFDTVVLNAVLEHFIYFEPLLQEAKRVAKNWIIIVLPSNSRGAEHYWPCWTVYNMVTRFNALGKCVEARKFKHWIIGVFEV